MHDIAAFLARSSWSPPTAAIGGVLILVLVILAIIALLLFIVGRRW